MDAIETKARELFDKYDAMNFHDCEDSEKAAKECAEICCDEIIKGLEDQRTFTGHKFHQVRFYKEVKEKIKSL